MFAVSVLAIERLSELVDVAGDVKEERHGGRGQVKTRRMLRSGGDSRCSHVPRVFPAYGVLQAGPTGPVIRRLYGLSAKCVCSICWVTTLFTSS